MVHAGGDALVWEVDGVRAGGRGDVDGRAGESAAGGAARPGGSAARPGRGARGAGGGRRGGGGGAGADVEARSGLPTTSKRDLWDAYPFGLLAVPREEVVAVHGSSGTG